MEGKRGRPFANDVDSEEQTAVLRQKVNIEKQWVPTRSSFGKDELLKSLIRLASGTLDSQDPNVDSEMRDSNRLVQVWYADDGTAIGRFIRALKWAILAYRIGPKYGYYLNLSKCKFTTTPQFLELVRLALRSTPFEEAMVCEGTEILGAFIGTDYECHYYVDSKVKSMAKAVTALAEVGGRSPQALHVAYTRALQHRTTYMERTTPTEGRDFLPMADAIRKKLMPNITGWEIQHDEIEELLMLPIRVGGLGLGSPVSSAEMNYKISRDATSHLSRALRGLEEWSLAEHSQIFTSTASEGKQAKRKESEKKADRLLSDSSRLPTTMKRGAKRAREHASANQSLFVTPCSIMKTIL